MNTRDTTRVPLGLMRILVRSREMHRILSASLVSACGIVEFDALRRDAPAVDASAATDSTDAGVPTLTCDAGRGAARLGFSIDSSACQDLCAQGKSAASATAIAKSARACVVRACEVECAASELALGTGLAGTSPECGACLGWQSVTDRDGCVVDGVDLLSACKTNPECATYARCLATNCQKDCSPSAPSGLLIKREGICAPNEYCRYSLGECGEVAQVAKCFKRAPCATGPAPFNLAEGCDGVNTCDPCEAHARGTDFRAHHYPPMTQP